MTATSCHVVQSSTLRPRGPAVNARPLLRFLVEPDRRTRRCNRCCPCCTKNWKPFVTSSSTHSLKHIVRSSKGKCLHPRTFALVWMWGTVVVHAPPLTSVQARCYQLQRRYLQYFSSCKIQMQQYVTEKAQYHVTTGFRMLCYQISANGNSLEPVIRSRRHVQMLLPVSLDFCCSCVGLYFCGSMVGGILKQHGPPDTGLAKSPQILICHTKLLAAKWWVTALLSVQKFCPSPYMLRAGFWTQPLMMR